MTSRDPNGRGHDPQVFEAYYLLNVRDTGLVSMDHLYSKLPTAGLMVT